MSYLKNLEVKIDIMGLHLSLLSAQYDFASLLEKMEFRDQDLELYTNMVLNDPIGAIEQMMEQLQDTNPDENFPLLDAAMRKAYKINKISVELEDLEGR